MCLRYNLYNQKKAQFTTRVNMGITDLERLKQKLGYIFLIL